jgi:hypothetical protein
MHYYSTYCKILLFRLIPLTWVVLHMQSEPDGTKYYRIFAGQLICYHHIHINALLYRTFNHVISWSAAWHLPNDKADYYAIWKPCHLFKYVYHFWTIYMWRQEFKMRKVYGFRRRKVYGLYFGVHQEFSLNRLSHFLHMLILIFILLLFPFCYVFC